MDFPEEGFHFVTRDGTKEELARVRAEVDLLPAAAGRAASFVKALVAIVGRPNAGKSSLFNALVGAARAIVTDVPGTTRDMLTERVDLEGLRGDAGRHGGTARGADAIEVEGVARARQAGRVAA